MRHWFKLDNAAKIYPPSRTRSWAALFRLSVTLTEEVDKETLAEAQENTLRRFPSFRCRLRRGFFWYYLEQISGAPPILDDIYNPMQRVGGRENNHFTYRLFAGKNRISAEFFHVLTDGTGGLTFLLSLVAEYLRLKHGVEVPVSDHILRCSDAPVPSEYEDSFLRYYRKETLGRTETKAYHQTGTSAPRGKLLFISATVPSDALRKKAEAYGVSVGVFLAALMMQAVYEKQKTEKSRRKRRQDVKICVPVNLRRFFPSRTLRNFSSYVNPSLCSRIGPYTFEEILAQVKHFMALHINEQELRARFSANVASEKNILLRLTPLVLKNPVMKFCYRFQGESYISAQISNMGLVRLPDELLPLIGRIDFMLGRASSKRTDCAVISAGGKTVLNFTRTTAEADVTRYFLTSLVKMGVPVYVESNGHPV